MFWVDRLVNKHLRIQRRSDPTTLFLYFLNPKNIFSLPPNAFNATKIAQFSKRMEKIWFV